MLRFPNPGSTIENFVSVYAAAFERLNGRVVGLDDIVAAVVSANLATSSGYMGDQAVARSTRADRSRDPLYNQLKMYAELFRILGWLHSTRESALKYKFTLLGEQVVAAGRDFWPLLDECILGVIYPTPVLTVLGNFDLRPFAFILRVMVASDGHLSRDEMIIGPLSAATDKGEDKLAAVVANVVRVRKSPDVLEKAIDAVAAARGVQVNTLTNYTRWPIALLRDSGWMQQGSAKFHNGRKYKTWRITEKGKLLAARIDSSLDIRVSDIEKLPATQREALALYSHYQMLERSGFDIAPVRNRIQKAQAIIEPLLTPLNAKKEVLFSPFQSLSLDDIDAIFPARVDAPKVDDAVRIIADAPDGRDNRAHLFVPPRMVEAARPAESSSQALGAELSSLLSQHGTIPAAAAAFASNHARDTQNQFYPLVTHLFQILGYKSDYSRAGVNYQRWDACVWVGDHALPVEIKSPTEELVLSTKAVRQALENKIVLLARGGLETNRDFTSLVVGNRLPNERSEMSNLIDDVFSAYGLRLGVIDLTSLAHLTLRAISEKVTIDAEQLSQLRGFYDV